MFPLETPSLAADTILDMVAVFLLAVALREDQTPMRAGCSKAAEIIAVLPKDAPVKLRYAMAGAGASCYAVTAELHGTKVQGYLPGAALSGLEEFDAARRRASSATLPHVTRPQIEQPAGTTLGAELYRAIEALQNGRVAEVEPILAKTGAPAGHRDVALVRASALLELNQPDRAREILEAALRLRPKDPQLLGLAGLACYRLDDPRSALAYWKESLELRPDPAIEGMLRRLDREIGADKSTQKTYGSRFLVRYDGEVTDPEAARAVVAALEQEFSRISMQLGCGPEERLVVILQSRESYRAATGAAEWNGGMFDGRIRVPLHRAKSLDPQTRQTLAHELVHACIATLGRWPTWVHEGLAQKLAGQTLIAWQRDQLRAAARAGKLPRLAALGESWLRLSSEEAGFRYGLALAAADELFRSQGSVAARNLLNNPDRLADTAAALDRALAANPAP